MSMKEEKQEKPRRELSEIGRYTNLTGANRAASINTYMTEQLH
jgi:hypothetical protein